MDVDLALDHRQIPADGYRTIRAILLDRGYREARQPFVFHRTVPASRREISVEVDLLGGEYEGTTRKHRTQQVQDVRVRKARGVDLAFDNPLEVDMEGRLPGGARDTVTLRVATIVPFITMKAMAIDSRLKEKDSWDVYFCLVNHPGGIDRIADEFKPHARHGLVREGLRKLEKRFATPEDVGPRHVTDFEELLETEHRDRIRRDAYERIQHLLIQIEEQGSDPNT